MSQSVDTHSWDLAEYFLSDDEHYKASSFPQRKAMTQSLAETIQDAVETWFEMEDGK